MAAEVNFACRTCGNGLMLGLGDPAARVRCSRCGTEAHLHETRAGAGAGGGGLERCAACGSRSLFVQRDFNRKLGIAVVVLAALLAVPTRGISLAVAVVVDVVLYRILPRITVCYACDAIHRGVRADRALSAFDHHVAEEFKEEKSKWEIAVRRWRREHAGSGS